MPTPGPPRRDNYSKLRLIHARAAVASSKHAPRGAGMRQLRDTILGLLGSAHETVCAECVATMLGQPVNVIMMTFLGLEGRLASFRGVCSVCRRTARVIGRAEPRHT